MRQTLFLLRFASTAAQLKLYGKLLMHESNKKRFCAPALVTMMEPIKFARSGKLFETWHKVLCQRSFASTSPELSIKGLDRRP